MLWTEPLLICGFGDVGSTVARFALSNGRHPHQVTVVEQDAELAQLAQACGHRIINSDATLVRTLRSAGAGVAATIIICVGDEDVLDAVQAARSVAPEASIQVVLNRSDDERAVMAAGADTVLNLSKIAGKLLADAALGASTGNDVSETG